MAGPFVAPLPVRVDDDDDDDDEESKQDRASSVLAFGWVRAPTHSHCAPMAYMCLCLCVSVFVLVCEATEGTSPRTLTH
jgi:hypothetical protein